jgi:hypothetical protein
VAALRECFLSLHVSFSLNACSLPKDAAEKALRDLFHCYWDTAAFKAVQLLNQVVPLSTPFWEIQFPSGGGCYKRK